MRSIVVSLFILAICLACSSGMAAVVSVDVTITAVDPQARAITVAYDTKDGKKTIELDVSRKADISVNGKATDLDSLRPGHKASVAYENSLEVVTKIAAVGSGDSNGQKLPEEETGVELFNGTDLQAWAIVFSKAARSQDANWAADPERKVLISQGGNQNWLETEEKYKDFVLTLEWRLPPGSQPSGNGSGVVVRAVGQTVSQCDPRGVEIDLGKNEITGRLLAYGTPIRSEEIEGQGEGNTVIKPTKTPPLRSVAKWNKCEITCIKDKLVVKINDVVVNQATGLRGQAGKICLRNQNTAIEFRNIRLVPMP
jgi:hypothetical protein